MAVSPPRPKMPALNSLRAFEAAARLESFSEAAAELSVTPGAVAQHVKSLEAWAGEKLFVRLPQGIELTSLGTSILADFITAFDQLGGAVNKLRANAAPREIRIAALPCVAQLWLSPKLPEIRTAMPDISISVTALEQRPNLKREPYDLPVFFEDHPVCKNSVVIARDIIFPVCSPTISGNLTTAETLENQVLLHDTSWQDDWKTWLTKTLPGKNIWRSGPAFSLYSLAVEEAKNGAGILMGHEALVRRQINSGSLVAPFDQSVELERSLTIETDGPIIPNSLLKNLIDRLSR
ncbi:MAG: LysR family transcriptional regulator [Rhizobiaceae bacterium]|nr:LysR family transcriptional regulator [Rhizobiaceae bacterium]